MLTRLLSIFCLIVIVPFCNGQGSIREICDNGIDDDNDMLIDLNDDDCPCEVIEPISLIPNPSFEELSCCPRERSQLNCAVGWIQASQPTTDLIHNCGWGGWSDYLPPQPFPDGDGIMGFRDGFYNDSVGTNPTWKEYAGACLINPMMADSTYRFQFDIGFSSPKHSPSITVTIFGTHSCEFLPFGTENVELGCPTNGPNWQKLGAARIEAGEGNKWVNVILEITPEENIEAIAIGPPCENTLEEASLYYFFDNLQLADITQFELEIQPIGHPCSNEFSLAVPESALFDYQWYLEGAALVGEIFPQLTRSYGEGKYQVRLTDGEDCRVSGEFEYSIPEVFSFPGVTICPEDTYHFGGREFNAAGSYVDTFTSFHGCDSIVTLDLRVLGETIDTISVEIFEGESFTIGKSSYSEEGQYLNTLESSLGCDSLVLLNLELFDVYSPNIFSPNDDGFNDTFTILGDTQLFSLEKLSIYDKWGNLLFEGLEWNGEYRDGKVREGVYAYTAILEFTNGKEKLISGTVSLIR